MKKKICIILFDASKSNGTERAVSNLASILQGDYEVIVISCFSKYESDSAFFKQHGISVLHLGIVKTKNKLYLYYQIIKKIKKLIYSSQPAFILGTTHAINILLPFIKAKQSKIIGCEHMAYKACPFLSRIIRFFIYFLLDTIVVLTQSDKKKYFRYKNIVVIPNSISFNTNEISSTNYKQIISVGRLEPQKGYDMLIDIAIQIKEKAPDWRIDIFGDGNERTQLEKSIKCKDLEDFLFLNYPTESIQNEYMTSSIYIMSSRHEGFPMVLLEAQACGLPIVSFNCPEGPSEIVSENKNGYLIELFNINQFAEAVIDLIRDEKKRKKFSLAARENSINYSSENIRKKWDLLFSALEER